MIQVGRIPYDLPPLDRAVAVFDSPVTVPPVEYRNGAPSFTRSTMILLTARDLSRQFDADPVFRGVCLEVQDGEKIGLVGPNGCGKTTLLNILAGRDEPDVGVVERHPAAAVGILEQEVEFPAGRTLREEVQSGLEHLYSLQQRAHDVAEQISATNDDSIREKLHRQYDELHQALDRLDAYHVEHRVDEVLHGLGFAEADYDRDLNTFSGGQQNRAILGRLLLASPDVMLLDEPTNHLDIATTEWLEGFLARSPQAVIVVSHDRYFLDRVTRRTVEIYRGGVNEYNGNFTAYWRQRKERHELQQRTYEKQQEFIARAEDFIRRNAYGQKHAQAKDREKKLARLERVSPPPGIDEPPITFPEPTRTGDWVLRAEGVSKSFAAGDEQPPLFRELSLQVDRGDRLAIFGPNGSGKTTLVRILTTELNPDTGAVRHGTGVRIAYFDQQLTSIASELSAVDAVRPEHDPSVTPGELRKLLARFGIRGDLAMQTVGEMSGGEKTRVALARLASAEPNVLILDEPTNHLDFWSAAALEQALAAYQGTAIVVSHDRFFLDRVATKMLVLEPGNWRLFEGNYSDYLHLSKVTGQNPDREAAEGPPSVSATAPQQSTDLAKDAAPRRRRRFPYRKVHEIEEEIAVVEGRIAELQSRMADPEVLRNGETIRKVTSEHRQAEQELATLVEHWEEALELN